MREIVSVQTMRDSDAACIAAGTPGRELMGRAAAVVEEKGRFHGHVGILCGSGGNGGDGYALALLLDARGLAVTVFTLSEKASEDGAYYRAQCRECLIPLVPYEAGTDLSGFTVLADCLLGTGFSGEPRGLTADAIRQINASGAYVVSVDIPSGLSGDSGLGECAVKADRTVSIGSLKPGHFLGRARDVRGELVNADIGIPPLAVDARLMEEADAAACIPRREHWSHKGKYGYAGLAGGSLPYSGAPRLAAMACAAMRSGAGVAVAAAPRSLCPLIAPLVLESTLLPLSENGAGELVFAEEEWAALLQRVKTLSFGMGIGRGGAVKQALAYVLAHFEGRLVIDADGLFALSGLSPAALHESRAQVLLTPHLGEASRLLGVPAAEIEREPLRYAKQLAEEWRCTVLLTGSGTVVTDGTETWITDRGCAGMATAGSGDVLSGVLAALLGYGEGSLPKLAAAGAYLCGLAGERAELDIGPTAMTAGDTARQIGQAVRRLELVRDRATV